MTVFTRTLMLVAATTGLLPVNASAQRAADRVAGIVVGRHTEVSAADGGARSGKVKTFRQGNAVGMANGALIGAGIGAAIGLVAAPILNAQNSDHSEDAMTYVMLPAFGAFLGLIVGGIIGWTRAP